MHRFCVMRTVLCVMVARAAAAGDSVCPGFDLKEPVAKCPPGERLQIRGHAPSVIFGYGWTGDSQYFVCVKCSAGTFMASENCETACAECAEGTTSEKGAQLCVPVSESEPTPVAVSTGTRVSGAVGIGLAILVLAPLCLA